MASLRLNYDVDLLNKFGGFVEGQYYFNNQWFVNALYAFSKAFNVSRLCALTVQNRYRWRLQRHGDAFASGNEPQRSSR